MTALIDGGVTLATRGRRGKRMETEKGRGTRRGRQRNEIDRERER